MNATSYYPTTAENILDWTRLPGTVHVVWLVTGGLRTASVDLYVATRTRHTQEHSPPSPHRSSPPPPRHTHPHQRRRPTPLDLCRISLVLLPSSVNAHPSTAHSAAPAATAMAISLKMHRTAVNRCPSRKLHPFRTVWLLLFGAAAVVQPQPLPHRSPTKPGPLPATLVIAPDGITTSGVSSGGAFAIQLHLAYSLQVQGAGIFAGPPYWCAQVRVGVGMKGEMGSQSARHASRCHL